MNQQTSAYACTSQMHQVHVPHLMVCIEFTCAKAWIDCPGETGVNYKDGCPRCGSIYWIAIPTTMEKKRV